MEPITHNEFQAKKVALVNNTTECYHSFMSAMTSISIIDKNQRAYKNALSHFQQGVMWLQKAIMETKQHD